MKPGLSPALPVHWLRPDWPAPPEVMAVCTTRHPPQSAVQLDLQHRPAYGAFNLGLHVGDAAQQVMAHRENLQQALGVPVAYLDQVHGAAVAHLPVQEHRGSADTPQADAAVTRARGIACTVMVADCLPVLLCSAQTPCVAAAHAGWRGLLGAQGQGILEATVSDMAVDPSQLLAWLGPCIGPDQFEVGPEVKEAFEREAPPGCSVQHHFRPSSNPGRWLADLAGLARQRLQRLGVGQFFGNDGSASWCTVTQANSYYSHRRDRVSGRMAACIWLR